MISIDLPQRSFLFSFSDIAYLILSETSYQNTFGLQGNELVRDMTLYLLEIWQPLRPP